MKILFVCQYFYPEVFRGNDIAFHWAEDGHEVHVVCGVPNYPDGVFHKGYGWFKRRHEVINGVKVTRLPIIPRGNNKILLILNYFSYLIVGLVYMLFHALFHKYDRVFVQQLSPVMMSAPGVLYKKLQRVPLYTWVLDYYLFHLFFDMLREVFPEQITAMPYAYAPRSMALVKHWGEQFDEGRWQRLVSRVCFHKLTYMPYKVPAKGEGTYYEYILKG